MWSKRNSSVKNLEKQTVTSSFFLMFTGLPQLPILMLVLHPVRTALSYTFSFRLCNVTWKNNAAQKPRGFSANLDFLLCACPSDYSFSSKHLTSDHFVFLTQYFIKTPESFQKIDNIENTVTLCDPFFSVPQVLALILLYIQHFT